MDRRGGDEVSYPTAFQEGAVFHSRMKVSNEVSHFLESDANDSCFGVSTKVMDMHAYAYKCLCMHVYGGGVCIGMRVYVFNLYRFRSLCMRGMHAHVRLCMYMHVNA